MGNLLIKRWSIITCKALGFTVLYTCSLTFFLLNRVLKQALRSSGANATQKHIEEVSLCSLFLMEAAKKADRTFGLTP